MKPLSILLTATLLAGVRPTAVPAQATPASGAPLNSLSPTEKAAGWRLLFDGTTTAGWRGYRRDAVPAGWQAVDGALTRVGAGGGILTRERFGNFESSHSSGTSPRAATAGSCTA